MKAALASTLRIFTAVALVAFCAAAAGAQVTRGRDLRVVSARAGGVNYVLGDVQYRRAKKDAWKALDNKVELKDGDVVRTGATGLAEVLLNPGSYLRLGPASEFEMTDTSLDSLRLRLSRGSAVVEATGYDKYGLLIKVETPRGPVNIVRTGIYRLNVRDGGETELVVEKGRVTVGQHESAAAVVVKKGSVARLAAGGAVETGKLDKKNRDELDRWSKERGTELAAANRRMTQQQATTLLASLAGINAAEYATSAFGRGVWYFDVRRGCYTFVPFAMGWRSPYGGFYDTMLWGHPMPCASCPYGYSNAQVYRGGSYGTPGATSTSGTYTGGGSASSGGSSGGTVPAPTISPSPAPAPARSTPGAFEGSPLRTKVSPDSEP